MGRTPLLGRYEEGINKDWDKDAKVITFVGNFVFHVAASSAAYSYGLTIPEEPHPTVGET